MDYNDYDDYEVLYDFDESEVESDSYSEPLSIPDAFLACRRQLHVANIGYIAELAHTTKEEVALALQGTALFQTPEFFYEKRYRVEYRRWLGVPGAVSQRLFACKAESCEVDEPPYERQI